MTVPYPVNEEGFKPAKGSIEHKGEYYKLIKQKFENDTLYVVCFKDYDEKRLVKNMVDYGKVSNDLPSKSAPAENLLTKLLKEYEPFNKITLIQQNRWCLITLYDQRSYNLLSSVFPIPSPPPKYVV